MSWGAGVKGVELFLKECDSVNNRMIKANVVSTRAGANVVKREAKRRINSTGKVHDDPLICNLRNHIVSKLYQKRPTNSVALVGPLFPGMTAQQRSYYGDWVENGHKMELGNGQVPPHPFLRPALDESKSEIKTKMVQVYQKALDKNFNAGSMIEELGENVMDAFSGGSSSSDADFND